MDNITLPVITNDFFNLCENDLTEDELLIFLKSMQNDKIPGNDGLTKDFYEIIWYEIKHVFLKSLKQAKEKGQLRISQRQAAIKLIGTKMDTKSKLEIGGQCHYLTLMQKLYQKPSPQS